jgi:hypothetical protein
LDLDGRPELILNLFNDTGDGRWHTVVLDAANHPPAARAVHAPVVCA